MSYKSLKIKTMVKNTLWQRFDKPVHQNDKALSNCWGRLITDRGSQGYYASLCFVFGYFSSNFMQISRISFSLWVCHGKCRGPQERRSWRCQPDSRPPVAERLYLGSWGRTLKQGGELGWDTAAFPLQNLDPYPCRFSPPSLKQQGPAEEWDRNNIIRLILRNSRQFNGFVQSLIAVI